VSLTVLTCAQMLHCVTVCCGCES